MTVIGELLYGIVSAFLFLLFVRFVVDWIQVLARSWSPTGVVLVILEIVYSITDPPIMFVRRFVPPLRIGPVALDTSFIIVLVACYLLLAVIRSTLV